MKLQAISRDKTKVSKPNEGPCYDNKLIINDHVLAHQLIASEPPLSQQLQLMLPFRLKIELHETKKYHMQKKYN